MKLILTSIVSLTIGFGCIAQSKNNKATDALKKETAASMQSNYGEYKKIALTIWDYAELGFKEEKSAALLQNTLKDNGFTVEAGVAGIPTAFVATYGSGSPVIGILAEYDALPGLSQDNSPTKTASANHTSGHACGHNLFGTGSVAAGIAVKKLLKTGKLKGTIKIFGCPAEEGGSGKVYMVREGLFDNVDVALHWHPSDDNLVTNSSSLANISAKFRFHGIASHAAGSPEKGRSALDAVEAMDHMVNMMREHVPQETRIHYVITSGGKAPNVVPDFAEVYYYVRNPAKTEVVSTFERIKKAAEGAALGTETKMDFEIIGGAHDLLINKTLVANMQINLEKVGGVTYTDDEVAYAKKMQATFTDKYAPINSVATVKPISIAKTLGSTDVGDVSYAIPTVGLRAATWVAGTSAHSWQAVASGGTEIGIKGMMVASKTLAFTAIDLFTNPDLIKKAKEEFIEAKGDYQYKALLGDREPALNYRD
ncbi:amidohydrolase [Flavobacterium algicola]|uniref:amidohydrolase n=1 Tax=Flavobacterium algicola TaxID=556529 RepID=UPI001EFC7F41|nr:amidohydrolase [Flavobacterium algicola]MCG9792926.1 amidohydrolase [Flavobacterium algicola]